MAAASISVEPAMGLRDLRFGYRRETVIVDQVNAALIPGRLTVLLGPNAAGKSTLLSLMMGQQRCWSGRCELLGQDVQAMQPWRRAELLSYVPQQGRSAFAFTVRQVVAMGRFALRRDDDAVQQALVTADLEPIADQVYNELSAGQQQRVLLARALAQSAGGGRVMLLDEPVASMDLRYIQRTMRMLRALARQRRLAVLAVLHDLNLAAQWADEIWLLHQGRLVAEGQVHQVLQPQVLEPVYGLRLRRVTMPGEPHAVLLPYDDSQDGSHAGGHDPP